MIFSGNIIYNESTLTYDDAGSQYGGVKDDLDSSLLTNQLVDSKKLSNKLVIDYKTNNSLVEKPTEVFYQRIFAGMPMGLLLSLTYPVDQDGEIRS